MRRIIFRLRKKTSHRRIGIKIRRYSDLFDRFHYQLKLFHTT